MIAINTLVELKDYGSRLFVHSYSRDCDETLLYNLSYKPIVYKDYIDQNEINRCFRFEVLGGFSEEALKIIKQE